jgi:hypothetical protein
VELGFPSVGDPLIPPGQGCKIYKHLKIAQMVVELETFVEEEEEEEEEDTTELGEVQSLAPKSSR